MAKLTHLDDKGAARMVDVGSKEVTARTAVAEGLIRMNAAALEALSNGNHPKGDAIAAARIAGIMAAKKTGELIPLCHPLALESVTVDFTTESGGIRVRSEATLTGKTGVEMEAMTAVSVALLTLYDMGKSLDKGMSIEAIRLLEKTGGKSGAWRSAD
ncbi:cyclic pyranopterin monophosphate synthase MoaC [Qipengyuania sp. 1XM1-15A]|uniref:cyclic pyranopterin monophosphate synthase MoaC n=1 Tax=Qipengyuania xiamenensis TaxID=2867237 RepID=UPI001C88D2D1|nr:cyclic pyranopterin monophosphate synthase MoaC [Qipengyuania xiamenensis]MBX7531534.1 cyclic pyranopterin monophosphate synthase MoaC [Qipengyuania xiamenensis]